MREISDAYEILDMLPAIVYETNAEGFIAYANTYGMNALGYTRDDMKKGLRALDVIAPHDRERAAAMLSSLLRGDRIKTGNEYRLICKCGRMFPARLFTTAIVRDGTIRGIRGIGIDISENKQAEEELRRQNEFIIQIIEHLVGL